MMSTSTEIADAERAVQAFKHKLLVRVMAAIIDMAKRKPYVSPADLPEDIVEPEHRQGVASNAWNALTALEIVERLPQRFNDEKLGIFAGRIKNTNSKAKGRWTACYRLRSLALADTWLERNRDAIGRTPAPQKPMVQTELGVAA